MITALVDLGALDAFYQEHRLCGDLEGDVETDRVWMACTCGTGITRNIAAATRVCDFRLIESRKQFPTPRC